jgi:hypothetical protein
MVTGTTVVVLLLTSWAFRRKPWSRRPHAESELRRCRLRHEHRQALMDLRLGELSTLEALDSLGENRLI